MSIKPSHLVDPVERMDTAEVLSIIVERACLFVPEVPVGITKIEKSERDAYRGKKVSKALTQVESPKEALTQVESPKEALTSVEKKDFVASSVRFK